MESGENRGMNRIPQDSPHDTEQVPAYHPGRDSVGDAVGRFARRAVRVCKEYGPWCLELALADAAFLLFVYVTCNRLDHSSLWFDEAIEYWYSKVWTGPLPFSDTTGLYERVLSTLQPPLYNVLLHFWLLISDSVWWFRFFGVVCGFLGMLGLYGTVRLGTGHAVPAAAVAASSCLYWMAYYWQEAAEYCLMLGLLFCTVFFWFRLISEPTILRTLWFTLFAILPVYSQYGAVFPVAAMGAGAFVFFLFRRNWKIMAALFLFYSCAVLFAAYPLYLYFVKQQLSIQHGGGTFQPLVFRNGFPLDCLDSLHSVFHWCFFPETDVVISHIILLIALIAAVLILIGGSARMRTFTLVNMAAWFLYYFAVKLGIYADMYYGGFGNRYNLFFYALWIPWGFLAAAELWRMQAVWTSERENLIIPFFLPSLIAGVTAGLLAVFCWLSWVERIQPNWEKEYIRDVVDHWYQETDPTVPSRSATSANSTASATSAGSTSSTDSTASASSADSALSTRPTLVYYAADAGFAYYLRRNPRFREDLENTIVYMPWLEDGSEEEYIAWLRQTYGKQWPEELLVAASHYEDDFFVLLQVFTDAGYTRRDSFNYGESCLLILSRRADAETAARSAGKTEQPSA